MDATPVKVLFVCVKKGVRAAIAKAIVEQQSNGMIHASCCGFEPGATPKVLLEELSKMLDVEIIGESKTVFEYKKTNEKFDYVITLCDQASNEQCHLFVGCVNLVFSHVPNKLHWAIPNLASAIDLPERGRRQVVKEVVEQINFKVVQLLAMSEAKAR